MTALPPLIPAASMPPLVASPPLHPPRLRRLPVLAAMLALAACASIGPDYRAPEMSLPNAWQASPPSAEAAPDLARWWTGLGDAQLVTLVEQALAANPDLAAAHAAVVAARARARVAGAGALPEFAASTSAGRTSTASAGGQSRFGVGVDAAWEIDLFGGTRRAVEAAGAERERAEAQFDGARVALAAEVGLQYIALRSAQQRLAIARANLASQSETLQITDWRVQAGLASSVDLEQARSNREQTAAQIPLLETNRASAEHALAVLVGQPPGALAASLAESAPLPAVPERVAVGIPAETLRQRPDIRAAERALAAETARVGVATADLYPALRLSGSIGSEALSFAALGAGSLTRSLLASVSGALFDGGHRQGQVDIQQALREQSLQIYRASVLTALQEVEDALVALANDRLRHRSLERAADAARNAALLARQRYQSGLIDFQTVLDTERSLRSVEDNLASATAERAASLIRLYKALGGGWSGDDAAPRPAAALPSGRNPT